MIIFNFVVMSLALVVKSKATKAVALVSKYKKDSFVF